MMDQRDDGNDPRPSGPRDELRRRFRRSDKAAFGSRPGISLWAWFASFAAAAFIIAIVYGFANQARQTAFDRNAPGPIANLLTGGASTGSGGTTRFGGEETTGAGPTYGRSTAFPPF